MTTDRTPLRHRLLRALAVACLVPAFLLVVLAGSCLDLEDEEGAER